MNIESGWYLSRRSMVLYGAHILRWCFVYGLCKNVGRHPTHTCHGRGNPNRSHSVPYQVLYIYGNDRVVDKVLGMKVTYAFHTALAHAYYVVTTLTGLWISRYQYVNSWWNVLMEVCETQTTKTKTNQQPLWVENAPRSTLLSTLFSTSIYCTWVVWKRWARTDI